MVPASVSEYQRLDVVKAILDMTEVGQDQVHSGLVVTGEEYAAVDDEQTAEMLKYRHVAPDFADTAQCGHPARPAPTVPEATDRRSSPPEPLDLRPYTEYRCGAHVGGQLVLCSAVAGICGKARSPDLEAPADVDRL